MATAEERAYQKKYRADHHDKHLAYCREYYQKNKQKWDTPSKRDPAKDRERSKRRYREYKQWLQSILETTPCADCGGTSRDWHHLDPSTHIADVSTMYGYSREKVKAEMDKCIILCRSCHKKRHITPSLHEEQFLV